MNQQTHENSNADLTFHSKAHLLPKLQELHDSTSSLTKNASWKEFYRYSKSRFLSKDSVTLYPGKNRSLIESAQKLIKCALDADCLQDNVRKDRIRPIDKNIFSLRSTSRTIMGKNELSESLYFRRTFKFRKQLKNVEEFKTSERKHNVTNEVTDNGDGDTQVDSHLNDLKSLSLSDHSISYNGKKHNESLTDSQICPLRVSLFASVPPTFNFTLSGPVMKLPGKISNILKWKLSSLTPPLIRDIVERSGFTLVKDEGFWTSLWGKHIHCHHFRLIKENQKVNHFPGTFHIGRKDRLWLNIVKMQETHGKQAFSFMPQTFILPQQMKQLENAWKETGRRVKWIIKPPASARGNGVSVIHRWCEVPQTESVIVQRYINHPYLINGTKFDLRLYVLVTSFDPLRLYVFDDGLVRFASVKYSRSIKNIGEKFIHLTNYSINRTNSCYTSNEDENVRQGHKWSLKSLWSYFRENHIDEKKVWSSLVDVVIKTIISCEDPINHLIRIYAKNRYVCYELFGFDIMLDNNLKPWLLEVNITPSLHSNSQLDEKIKAQLVKDTLNTVGIHVPQAVQLVTENQLEFLRKAGIHSQKNMFWNKNLYRFSISADERRKHSRFEKVGGCHLSVLNDLTPDDLRQLIQSEDELTRCGNFVRIFPSQSSSTYLNYFEAPKYYNILLNAWELKYHGNRNDGIEILQNLCKQRYHLRSTGSHEEFIRIINSKSNDKRVSLNEENDVNSHGDYFKNITTKKKKIFPSKLFPLHFFSNQPGEI